MAGRPMTATLKRMLVISLGWMIAFGSIVALTSCAADDRSTDGASETSMPAKTTVARKSVTYDFVVPAGTYEKIKKGEDPGLFPRQLDVHVGDKIRVRNDDTKLVRLGLFDVAPGETVTMNFNKPGVRTGSIMSDDSGGCGSPPPDDKVFRINVKP